MLKSNDITVKQEEAFRRIAREKNVPVENLVTQVLVDFIESAASDPLVAEATATAASEG